ncbi:MAG: division/cell wall cluster transcriptional repressor MraZ [Clostridiales Family XIII bacterium]|jgi:MraZ protein|nr:division/cell wall cluster transcriptional repressor MraZ [Clostridiales Family XIII bacterium]
MLTGSYFNTVDSKGRAFVPTKLRYGLEERVWLAIGLDACIYVMAQDKWNDFLAEYITPLSLKDGAGRKLQRQILGNSREVEIDGHGRINIPPDYLAYAGIEKDIVFVGVGDRIELWDKKAYDVEMDPKTLNLSALILEVANHNEL